MLDSSSKRFQNVFDDAKMVAVVHEDELERAVAVHWTQQRMCEPVPTVHGVRLAHPDHRLVEQSNKFFLLHRVLRHDERRTLRTTTRDVATLQNNCPSQ